jgi:hypothetical protein
MKFTRSCGVAVNPGLDQLLQLVHVIRKTKRPIWMVTMLRVGKPTWMQKSKLLSLPDAENEKTG